MFVMKKIFCLVFFFLLIGVNGFSQSKKIKLKKQGITFIYQKDSSVYTHKENKRIAKAFVDFYQYVKANDYKGYLSMLSPATLKEIREDKLKRKFEKFKSYAVNFSGNTSIRSIQLYASETFEPNAVFIVVAKLPEGQTATKRIGFDPLKKATFNGVENYVGIHMTLTDDGYKVVIPW